MCSGFGMALDGLSVNVQGYFPALLKDEHGERYWNFGSWVVLGFSRGIEVFFGLDHILNVSWGQDFYDGPKIWS